MDTTDTTSRGFVPTAARAMILIAQEAARLERAPHIRTTEVHPDGLTESVYIDGEYMGDQPTEAERWRLADEACAKGDHVCDEDGPTCVNCGCRPSG